MALRRDEAVVIRAMNYGEADKIVSFYTPRFGKVKGIAKGARKPKNRFSSSLEPFNLGQIVFFEKENAELCLIRSFDVVERFDELRTDLEKLSLASAS
ncbi:DNA repair protein RecO, partial [Candidatus Poribacteria bacterium]